MHRVIGRIKRRLGAALAAVSAAGQRGGRKPPRAQPRDRAEPAQTAGPPPEDVESAVRPSEQAGDSDDAIARAFQAGDLKAAIALMEDKGAYFDAARTALEMDETELSIRLLQRVSVHDPSYGESCIALTKLFAEGGEPELALGKLDDAVGAFSVGDLPVLRDQVARSFEEKGELEAALEALEDIRRRDGAYPGVAERIEKLRARLLSSGALEEVAAEEPPSTAPLEERYEIQRELGRGAMSIVYRARDRYLDRVVALKRLPDELKDHPTVVPLFLSEARTAAALDHPNIVRYFEVDQHNGVYYLTMECLEGVPLDVMLKRRSGLSVRDTLRISAQVAAGMAYAHSKRIVHRDLKPANLFHTTDRQVKIMDFGLAKVIGEVKGASSVILGTPSYMAPEQESGDPVDHRADQYALGVTMFELVTGRRPFLRNVAYNHRETRPPDPREFSAEVPDGLAKLILRLMSKDVGGRFAQSDEIVSELERLLRDAAIA